VLPVGFHSDGTQGHLLLHIYFKHYPRGCGPYIR
jgi:hypothetical protein